MKYLFYFFIFCMITISTSKAENNFKVAPVFFSKYKSNGGDWHFSKQSILINGFGLTSTYLNNDLEIISDYIQLFITGNIDNDKFLYFSPRSLSLFWKWGDISRTCCKIPSLEIISILVRAALAATG